MKGYRVYSKIQQFRSAGFSQRQVARRLGINRKTVKRYWEMPVDEYEEMSSTVCRMQYLDKYQARILEWLRVSAISKCHFSPKWNVAFCWMAYMCYAALYTSQLAGLKPVKP